MPKLAIVLAATALAVAVLGSTTVAGAVEKLVVPKRSVGTSQLKDGAVTSGKVRDGSLLAVDFKPGQLPTGPPGERGEQGAPGVSGWELVSASTGYDSNSPKTMVVVCPEGKRLLGGSAGAWGRAMIHVPAGVALTASHAAGERTWVAAAQELVPTDETWFLQATAVCATVR